MDFLIPQFDILNNFENQIACDTTHGLYIMHDIINRISIAVGVTQIELSSAVYLDLQILIHILCSRFSFTFWILMF